MVITNNKSGQVWVETVIYTLIAFVMISTVLAIAKPKIQEMQDQTYVEQSIEIMQDINNIFLELAQGGAGNKRLIELGINKGDLKIDSLNDQLVFEIQSSYLYSEPGKDILNGNILINTKERGDEFIVNMTQDYSDMYNITYKGKDELKIISPSSAPYKLYISNKGKDTANKIIINFEMG